MSTKVYDGMMTDLPMHALYKLLESIKHECADIAEGHVAKNLARIFCQHVDRRAILGDSRPETDCFLFGSIVSNLREAHQKVAETRRRDPRNDMQLELGIYPIEQGVTLINPIFEQHEYSKVLLRVFKDFAYWNNTDPDPKVSVKEWNYRRECWEKTYYRTSLSWTAFQHFGEFVPSYMFDKEEYKEFRIRCLRLVPIPEERTKDFVSGELLGRYPCPEEYVKENRYGKAANYCRSLRFNHPKEAEEIHKEFSAKLPKITLDMFDSVKTLKDKEK